MTIPIFIAIPLIGMAFIGTLGAIGFIIALYNGDI